MTYTESLPPTGPGSRRWFESVFNHQIELNRVLTGLTQGFSPQIVIDWLRREVTTFLTERAVGQTALTIQPATHYSVEIRNGVPSIVEQSLSEYGDLAESFVNFDSNIPEVAIGLNKAFTLLSTLELGEGVVIFSPAANYEGSTSDVINIFTVKDRVGDKTIVTSHFLFLNCQLSREQRAHWLSLHESDPDSEINSPRQILANPQLVGINPDGTPLSPQEYIDWTNLAFIERYGKPLFAKPQDESMFHHISETVSENIYHLFNILRNEGADALYLALWKIIEGGQKLWAKQNRLEPIIYWEEILDGLRPLCFGFHPADSTFSLYSPMLNFPSLFNHSFESIFSRYCRIHGHYHGNHCPKCDKHIES